MRTPLERGQQFADLINDKRHGADAHWLATALSVTITNVTCSDYKLTIDLDTGASITIEDVAQSCCENRYMSCDDDLASFGGARLRGIEIAEAPSVEGEHGDVHDQQFLKVETTEGDFTVVTHNEHNGYYGGFSINTRWHPAPGCEDPYFGKDD